MGESQERNRENAETSERRSEVHSVVSLVGTRQVVSLSGSKSVLGGAEHERLVEDTDAAQLVFEFLAAAGEAVRPAVELGDADGRAFEDGRLGRLLIRRRKSLLEAVITFPQLVAATLLRLDALLADVFSATLGLAIAGSMRRKIVIFLKVAKVVLFLWLADGSSASRAGRRCTASASAVTVNKSTTIALWRGARESWSASTSARRVARRRRWRVARRMRTASDIGPDRRKGRSRVIEVMHRERDMVIEHRR